MDDYVPSDIDRRAALKLVNRFGAQRHVVGKCHCGDDLVMIVFDDKRKTEPSCATCTGKIEQVKLESNIKELSERIARQEAYQAQVAEDRKRNDEWEGKRKDIRGRYEKG